MNKKQPLPKLAKRNGGWDVLDAIHFQNRGWVYLRVNLFPFKTKAEAQKRLRHLIPV